MMYSTVNKSYEPNIYSKRAFKYLGPVQYYIIFHAYMYKLLIDL